MRCALPACGSRSRATRKGLDETLDDPQLAPAEACVRVQFGAVADFAREYRKRGLHWLDVTRIRQALGDRAAIFGIERRERQVGFGADLLQHLPRVQLVLAGDHSLRRCAGQAGTLGDQGCGQCAKLFVVRDHPSPAALARAARLGIGKTIEIEADQARVAGERKEVEAGFVEIKIRRQRLLGNRVPVVGEEGADALAGGVQDAGPRHRLRQRPPTAQSSTPRAVAAGGICIRRNCEGAVADGVGTARPELTAPAHASARCSADT